MGCEEVMLLETFVVHNSEHDRQPFMQRRQGLVCVCVCVCVCVWVLWWEGGSGSQSLIVWEYPQQVWSHKHMLSWLTWKRVHRHGDAERVVARDQAEDGRVDLVHVQGDAV